VGADQGHYDGYTQDDFDRLLDTLAGIQGKFLLSSYRNKALNDISEKKGWYTIEIRLCSPMTNKRGGTSKSKIEVLTANYPIDGGGHLSKKG
jgi:DNA adenine methylase